MTKTISLESLIEELRAWRSQKKKPGEKIPEHLWAAAIDLAGRMPPSSLASKLGLNSTELKRRMGKKVNKRKVKTKITFQRYSLPKSEGKKEIMELTSSSGISIRLFK
jgi:hypothetical protein